MRKTELQWLIDELREAPMSVRQLHRRTRRPKTAIRMALEHLLSLGVVERRRLHGGGHEWRLAHRR